MASIDPRKLFAHKQAIRDRNREFFTGRQAILSRILDALAVPGAAVAIYGDAGIGKTSVAWQSLEILRGDHELVERLKIATKHDIDRYYCCWHQFHEGMIDLEAILLTLLVPGAHGMSLPELFPKAFTRELTSQIKSTWKLSLRIVEANKETVRVPSPSSGDLLERKGKVHALFHQALGRIRSTYPARELIIFLDDFERVPNRAGVGGLIKDTQDARFVIVGTGDNVLELISDHKSSGRKLEGSKIAVPAFSEEEVFGVFDRAERVYPGRVQFKGDFRRLVVEYADGFPWIVQLLGYFGVLEHDFESGSAAAKEIGVADFDKAAHCLASDVGDVDRYEKLRTAVGSSRLIEALVFVLARLGRGWVDQGQLERNVMTKEGLDAHLNRLQEFDVLKRSDGRIRFADPIYRAMVLLAQRRGSIAR